MAIDNNNSLSLGSHYLIDLYECDSSLLNDICLIKSIINGIIQKIGAHLVSEHFKEFTPIGISGFAIISESHISIHTWPEYSFAAIDIFSCNKKVAEGISDYVKECFRARTCEMNKLGRGMLNKLDMIKGGLK